MKTTICATVTMVIGLVSVVEAQDFRFERQSSSVYVDGLYGGESDDETAEWSDDDYDVNAAGFTDVSIYTQVSVNPADQVVSNGVIVSGTTVMAGGEGVGWYPRAIA